MQDHDDFCTFYRVFLAAVVVNFGLASVGLCNQYLALGNSLVAASVVIVRPSPLIFFVITLWGWAVGLPIPLAGFIAVPCGFWTIYVRHVLGAPD